MTGDERRGLHAGWLPNVFIGAAVELFGPKRIAMVDPSASEPSEGVAVHPVVRIGDYEVIASAAAEREADGGLVWYGSAVARRVAGGATLEAAFDYYKVACASEHEALAFAVQRTSERILVTFGTRP